MPPPVPRTNNTTVVFEAMLLRHNWKTPALFDECGRILLAVATMIWVILARTKVSKLWQLGRSVIVVHG